MLVDEYFKYGLNQTPQIPLLVKAYHMGVSTTIHVTCENNQTTEMTPKIYEQFQGDKEGRRAYLKLRVNLRQVSSQFLKKQQWELEHPKFSPFWVYVTYTMLKINRYYFQGLSNTLDDIFTRHPGKPWLMHFKLKSNLQLMRSMRSGQRKRRRKS